MLFHVTMTHTVEDCPGYNREKFPELVTAWERKDELAKQFNVKVHFMLNGLPEHVEFALLEADSPLAVANFLGQLLPFRNDYKVTAVQHTQDVVAAIKAMMAQK